MKRNWKSLMVSGTVLTVLAGALTLPALASVGQRTAALHYQNIKVTLDGRTLDLTDSRGNEVEPFTIDGTTYLPLASISKALGMDVRWDADTNTVILNTKGTGTTAAESYIGVERAKEIALKDAGLSASQVSFVRAGLDWDNGRMEYEVEFWKDNVEYDFSQGACVAGEDTAAFLEDALSQLGLTRREANEFIVYWLPHMEGNAYNLIAFQTSSYTDHARLTADPAPDTVLRVFMAWKGLEEPVEVPPQVLTPTPRTGFTVVEWGGAEVQ